MKCNVVTGFVFVWVFCLAGSAAAEVSLFPPDGATGVFNFTPITVEFAEAPAHVTVTLTPTVAGTITVQGNKAVFQPTEAFLPQTEYTVTVTWDGGSTQARFTSVNEIKVLFEDDFSDSPVGQFPAKWKIRPEEDATPNYRVVEFPQSASGYALHAFDGGINWGGQGHALILAKGIEPLSDPNSKILIESVVWIDKGAIWRTYLFPAEVVWPPYKDIGAASATRPIDHTDLRRHVVHHVYDPVNQTIETYFDYQKVAPGNPAYREATVRTYPIPGRVAYNIGIYTQGKNTTEMYWERIRVAEIGR